MNQWPDLAALLDRTLHHCFNFGLLVVVASVAVSSRMTNCSLLTKKQHHFSSDGHVLAAGFVIAAVVEGVMAASLNHSPPCRECPQFQVRFCPWLLLIVNLSVS